jgi:alanyl aminopeptidase
MIDVVQDRYRPLGSTLEGSSLWQIPVCVRYGDARTAREACTLMTGPSARIDVEGDACPSWVMPNEDAAGYYRWSLGSAELRALLETGWRRLTPAERLSVSANVRAAFSAGTASVEDVLFSLDRVAADSERLVQMDAAPFYQMLIDDYLDGEPRARARAHVAELYAPAWRRIGWTPRRREPAENALFRRDLLMVMVRIAREPSVRGEAAERGRRFLGSGDGPLSPDAVDPDLLAPTLWAALHPSESGADPAVFDRMLAAFASSPDALVRQRLLTALSSVEDPALAARALALNEDPMLRVNEVMLPIFVQAETPEGRVRAFDWVTSHFDALAERLATTRAGYVPLAFGGFCSVEDRGRVESFFGPRIEALPGGPRNLAAALETAGLCAARREQHHAAVEAWAASLAAE